MKRSAINHTKLSRLCRLLKIKKYDAVGILECIWHLTATEAPTGDIGKLSDEDIGAWLEYSKPSEVIHALVTARWLDVSENHRLLVHDWCEHAEDAVQMKLARATQLFSCGCMPSLKKFSKDEKERILAHYVAIYGNAVRTAKLRCAHKCALEDHEKTLPLPLPLPSPSIPQRTGVRTDSEPLFPPMNIKGPIERARAIYAETGKPLNDRDWESFAMEVTGQGADWEQVLECLEHDAAGWIGREPKMIQFPVNWAKKSPWTRMAPKKQEATPADVAAKQAEYDAKYAHVLKPIWEQPQ